MAKTLLITGGCGFIGSNFIIYLIENFDYKIINLDALTYAGNPENLISVENSEKYSFVKADIRDRDTLEKIIKNDKIDGIINFAAESHVDRSIMDARPFIDTNVIGTMNLMDMARKYEVPRFLQVSTDEVYGSLGDTGLFTEESHIQPNSPYSASKASADHLVMAYNHTYGFPAVITRCSNNYGPMQFPEKLIPLMISNAREDKSLPVYGDGMNIRDWIHVHDHNSAVLRVFEKGNIGEVYNVGGNSEKPNIEIVKRILSTMNKPESLITYVKDRPGHDRRYAIDATKIKNEIGWEPEIQFEHGIDETIKWYLDNQKWVDNVRSGAYLEYYTKQYGNK